MKRITLALATITLFAIVAVATAKAKLPFHFNEATNTQLTSVQLNAAESTRTHGVVNKKDNTITFIQKKIQLVVRTGPEDDMLSYRIEGLRNPTVIVPKKATVKVLFMNVDDDMHHDFRLGAIQAPFSPSPGIADTTGSAKLAPQAKGVFTAQRFSYVMNNKATLSYYCSVGAHAKNGMFGKLIVK
ncbi:MAG: hypothetical protein ABI210_12900 [Abditibacteriaceae bacterium]